MSKPNQKPEPKPVEKKSTFAMIQEGLDKAKEDKNAVGSIVVLLHPDGSVNIQTVQQNSLELLYMAKLLEMHITSGFQLEKKTK